MRNRNRVELVGNVGQDPDVRETKEGTPYTRFSMATTDRWKGKDGTVESRTEWHNVVFWGPRAKAAAMVKKGMMVLVEGSLRSSEYVDEEQVKRKSWEVSGRNLEFVSPKEEEAEVDETEEGEPRRATPRKPSAANAQAAAATGAR